MSEGFLHNPRARITREFEGVQNFVRCGVVSRGVLRTARGIVGLMDFHRAGILSFDWDEDSAKSLVGRVGRRRCGVPGRGIATCDRE